MHRLKVLCTSTALLATTVDFSNMHENIENIRSKFKIEQFCCCFPLRTGCFVIGTLGWILTILKIAFLVGSTIISEQPATTYYDIEYKICYIFIMLAACAALLWGAYKYKKGFLRLWLIMKGFESILMTIMTIVYFGLLFSEENEILFGILVFFAFLIGTGLSWYFWICVWNFYHCVDHPKSNAVAPESVDESDKISHMG